MSRSFIPIQTANTRQILNEAETKDLDNLQNEIRDRQLQQNFNVGAPEHPHHSPLSDEQLVEMAREKVGDQH